jgi:hypothetical protein
MIFDRVENRDWKRHERCSESLGHPTFGTEENEENEMQTEESFLETTV